jgi:rhamnose utilization protein RhaD (predicted bifunctional aldolase and dehydrogenase)
MNNHLPKLLALSHEIGRADRRLAILGEGNTSVDLGDGTFLVKSSGSSLSNLDESGVSRVNMATVLAALDDETLDDSGVQSVLEASRADASPRLPSVETFMHMRSVSTIREPLLNRQVPTPSVLPAAPSGSVNCDA